MARPKSPEALAFEALPPQGARASKASRAKSKYNNKAYRAYMLHLKPDEDAAIISEIEAAKAQGVNPVDYFRRLYKEAAAAR